MKPELTKFLPKFYGIETDSENQNWLVNENLYFDGIYNQVDIKLANTDKTKY